MKGIGTDLMPKQPTNSNYPTTEQRRYPAACSDLGETNAIPYWQPTLKAGECRRDADPKDHITEMNLQVPSTMTFTVRGRER